MENGSSMCSQEQDISPCPETDELNLC